jgi:hypothetical protein
VYEIVSGLIIWDTPYGLGVASWDALVLAAEELGVVLDQVNAVNAAECVTVALWATSDQLGPYKEVLAASNYSSDIAVVVWYKSDQNYEGPNDRFVNSTEYLLIGRRKSKDASKNHTFLSKNPLERHNVIEGPTKRNYLLNAKGEKVNIHEKPSYLSEWLCRRFCRATDWALVIGAGAGGEVLGCIDYGINVCAIERDPVQVKELETRLATFDATQQMNDAKEIKKLKKLEKTDKKPSKEVVAKVAKSCPNCGCDQNEHLDRKCVSCDKEICKNCSKSLKGLDGFLCGAACEQKEKRLLEKSAESTPETAVAVETVPEPGPSPTETEEIPAKRPLPPPAEAPADANSVDEPPAKKAKK